MDSCLPPGGARGGRFGEGKSFLDWIVSATVGVNYILPDDGVAGHSAKHDDGFTKFTFRDISIHPKDTVDVHWYAGGVGEGKSMIMDLCAQGSGLTCAFHGLHGDRGDRGAGIIETEERVGQTRG